MKRNIIQLGRKTHVVSLPQHWIEKLGLKKKDEVEVTERGEELIISPEKTKEKKKLNIKIKEKNQNFVRHLFLILGSLGYDEVEIEVDRSELFSVIHQTAQEFSSFVLVEQSSTKCLYKMVSKEDKEEFDYILERCFKVTQSLADNFLELIKAKNYQGMKNLYSLEKTNNQLTTLGQRILIKSGYHDQDKTCFVYVLLWNLEIIADFYRRACYFLSESKKKIKVDEKMISIVQKSNELLRTLSNMPKNADVEKFIELFDEKAKIGDDMDSIFKKGNYEDIVLGHYLMDIITYIQDCAVVYLGILYGKITKQINS